MRLDHDRGAAGAKQPRPKPKRKAATPKATSENGMLTVAGAAELLQTSSEQVLALIGSNRLKAANVGKGIKRPRWRISREVLDQFMRGRETAASGERTRTRRINGPAEVEFF